MHNQRDAWVERGRVEPSANLRALADTLFEMHVALTDRGFTESQSLVMLNALLCDAVGGDAEPEVPSTQ